MAFVCACSHEWDGYEPLPPDASASTAASGSSGTASSSGAGGAGPTGSGGAAGGEATSGSGGGGASAPGTVEVAASIADCIGITTPDPDECEMVQGAGIMTVDTSDSIALTRYSFVRFDLDDALSGKVVESVTLRMTTVNTRFAGGPAAGEVWQVSEFTRPELFVQVPAKIGSTPVAADPGAVVANQLVEWQLPPDLIGPSSGVFLAILPLGEDGIDYHNLQGGSPPRLTIAYR